MLKKITTATLLIFCVIGIAQGSIGYEDFRTELVNEITIVTDGTFVTLSWNEVTDATGYTVYSSDIAEGPFFEDQNGIFDGTQWAAPISASRKFYYVTALVDSGTMVFIQGGTIYPTTGIYTDGLTVSSFYIDKYEVTQASFFEILGYNPAQGYGLGDTYPVYTVPWFAAIEYCNRRSVVEELTPCYSYLGYGTNPDNWPTGWNTDYDNHTNVSCDWNATGYRLPSEAEWEFAARGGLQTHGYTYSGGNDIWYFAWYGSNSSYVTHPVGLKDANELGIYDMSGNVSEWCWDICYTSRRRVRGGSFDTSASGCTVWADDFGEATSLIYYFGFRVCKTAF